MQPLRKILGRIRRDTRSGFTLVEAMVAMSILSIAALLSTKIMMSQLQLQKKFSGAEEADTLITNIRAAITHSCDLNLSGHKVLDERVRVIRQISLYLPGDKGSENTLVAEIGAKIGQARIGSTELRYLGEGMNGEQLLELYVTSYPEVPVGIAAVPRVLSMSFLISAHTTIMDPGRNSALHEQVIVHCSVVREKTPSFIPLWRLDPAEFQLKENAISPVPYGERERGECLSSVQQVRQRILGLESREAQAMASFKSEMDDLKASYQARFESLRKRLETETQDHGKTVTDLNRRIETKKTELDFLLKDYEDERARARAMLGAAQSPGSMSFERVLDLIRESEAKLEAIKQKIAGMNSEALALQKGIDEADLQLEKSKADIDRQNRDLRQEEGEALERTELRWRQAIELIVEEKKASWREFEKIRLGNHRSLLANIGLDKESFRER